MMAAPILRVENLKTYFPIYGGLTRHQMDVVRAVDGVTFEVARGETLGIVGESGSGKSTMLRSLIGLAPLSQGRVELEGRPVQLKGREAHRVRQTMQMVFQDPYASLNPRQTVGNAILEPIKIMHLYPRNHWPYRLSELLETVGLNREDADKLPHHFSGGQRQRIAIARALASNAQVILLDEPVSALDVSIQAQVLNVLEDLQRDLHLTYVFVSHDLAVVRYLSKRILVLHNGRMVEMADTEELFSHPVHSYTRALLSAIPLPDPEVEQAMAEKIDESWGTSEKDLLDPGQSIYENSGQWTLVRPGHYVAM